MPEIYKTLCTSQDTFYSLKQKIQLKKKWCSQLVVSYNNILTRGQHHFCSFGQTVSLSFTVYKIFLTLVLCIFIIMCISVGFFVSFAPASLSFVGLWFYSFHPIQKTVAMISSNIFVPSPLPCPWGTPIPSILGTPIPTPSCSCPTDRCSVLFFKAFFPSVLHFGEFLLLCLQVHSSFLLQHLVYVSIQHVFLLRHCCFASLYV